jgi:RNA polymerase sigma factor (sigma-70 family)
VVEESWVAALKTGQPETAWDLFLGSYRHVIVATARRVVHDHDDTMDVFSRTCELLREDECRRLREYALRPTHAARPSTWLAAVVRNVAVDFLRHRDGRQRLPAAVQSMPDRAQQLYRFLFHQRMSQVEAFESLRARSPQPLPFREFLADLRTLYGAVLGKSRLGTASPPYPDSWETGEDPPDLPAIRERSAALEAALESLTPEDRLVLELYVIEELPARDVARMMKLQDAKAVYNHSYRALAALRAVLKGTDLDPEQR